MTQEDLIIGLIYIMAEERNPELINMLQKSSVLVTSESSSDSILDASLNALKDSPSFRQNLSNYFIKEFNLSDGAYLNAGANKYDPITGLGGSQVGNVLRRVFTPENIDTLIAGGIGFATTKLATAASKKGNEQAIEFTKAESEKAAYQLEYEKEKAKKNSTNDGKKTTPKWVLPVAIGGGLLIIGVVVYFAMKKK